MIRCIVSTMYSVFHGVLAGILREPLGRRRIIKENLPDLREDVRRIQIGVEQVIGRVVEAGKPKENINYMEGMDYLAGS